MATASREELLARLATARQARGHKTEVRKQVQNKTAPTPKPPAPTQANDSPPSNPSRELASKVAKHAMIAGWDVAIQQGAYENNISEDRMRALLDEAEAYNEKADPSGRIEELRDWKVQKQGRSDLAAKRR